MTSWLAGARWVADQLRSSLGWRDPRYLASRPGEERAHRFVAMLLVLQRASYLAPALANTIGHQSPNYRSPALNLVVLSLAIAWNVGLVAGIHRRGWISNRLVGADVVIACLLLLVVTANCPPGQELTAMNWATKTMLATAALIGAVLNPLPAVLVSLAPATTYVVALTKQLGTMPPLVSGLNSYVWFVVIAHFMRRYLCSQARVLDKATAQRLTAQTQRAAEQARFAERIAHYRTLHDTVLTTLTTIARGGLEQHQPEVLRQRCQRDADYVRRLIDEDTVGTFTSLSGKLAKVVTEAEDVGLRVHYKHDALPAHLPMRVIDAVADASREALTNVAKHAGTMQAWLTVTWDDGTLTVRVVDRGRGFDQDTTPLGFGLRWSVLERLTEIGGEANVTGMRNNGACVELMWPGSASGAARLAGAAQGHRE